MDWVSRFDGLDDLAPGLRDKLLDQSKLVQVKKDTVVFGPDKAPDSLLLLIEGSVRVQQLTENGREIVLYRVHAGDSCIMTTACLMAYEDYSAEGIAETEVKAVSIPRSVFEDMISQSPEFRKFIFSTYSKRITDLFLVIEDIAFQRMDIRLAQKILELSKGGNIVKTTHQKLAAELGTAREVVSRLMQELQRHGWVQQSRGTVEILDRAGLEGLIDKS